MKGEIRLGKISSIDYAKGMARVVYPEKDDDVTRLIPLLSHEYKMPPVGSQVLVVHLSNGTEAGVVMGRPWSEKNAPPEGGATLYRKDLGQNPGDAMIRYDGSTLTITGGSVEVQAPRITNEGETITCSKAELVLTFNEEIVGTAALTMEAAEIPGSYTADISGITFNIPSMEDDQQLSIRLDVTLSNGQFLTAPGGTFSFLNGEMVSSVG